MLPKFMLDMPPRILKDPADPKVELPVFKLMLPVDAPDDLPVSMESAPVCIDESAVLMLTVPDTSCELAPELRAMLPPVLVSEAPATREIDAPCVLTLLPVATITCPALSAEESPVPILIDPLDFIAFPELMSMFPVVTELPAVIRDTEPLEIVSLVPDSRRICPPVWEVALPPRMAIFPPRPLVVDPATTFCDPESSREAPDLSDILPLVDPSPVWRDIAPEALIVLSVLIDTSPLEAMSDAPLASLTDPPVSAALDPALNCTDPPSNVDAPTVTATFPETAPEDPPVPNVIEPDSVTLEPVNI